MTLLELVGKYKGTATISVSNIQEGGTEFVVDFDTAEAPAIKDSIMSSEVVHFSAAFANGKSAPTIRAVVKLVAEPPASIPEDVEHTD